VQFNLWGFFVDQRSSGMRQACCLDVVCKNRNYLRTSELNENKRNYLRTFFDRSLFRQCDIITSKRRRNPTPSAPLNVNYADDFIPPSRPDDRHTALGCGHFHEFMFGQEHYGVPDPDFPSARLRIARIGRDCFF